MKNRIKYLSLILIFALCLLTSCKSKGPSTESTTTLAPTSNEVTHGSVKKIVLDTENATKVIFLGEEFNSNGLKVYAEYQDGYLEELTDYQVAPQRFNNQKTGSYNVKVTYKAFSELYTVYVKTLYDGINELIGLEVLSNDREVTFKELALKSGYDYSDIKVNAIYKDGTKKDVTSESRINKDLVNLNKRGAYEVKISYSEEFTLLNGNKETITEDTFFLVLIDDKAVDMTYRQGTTEFKFSDEITYSDMTFTIKMESGAKEVIDASKFEYDIKPRTPGSHVVTFSYTQKQFKDVPDVTVTCELEITVNEKTAAEGVIIRNYSFNALTLDAEGSTVLQKNEIDDYFKLSSGDVVKKYNTSQDEVIAVELGKAKASYIEFTVYGDAEVTLVMSSTGASNSSEVALFNQTTNEAVSNNENKTSVSGTSGVTLTYTLTKGTYRIYCTDNNRGARLISIQVKETL